MEWYEFIIATYITLTATVLPLGKVGCKLGPIMAASDSFTIDVKGKGGHGAMPHSTVDAIVESAALVTSLQTIVSRNKVVTML